MGIVYDPRVGNYRGEKGRLISRSTVQQLIREDALSKNNQYKELATKYIKNKITIETLQEKLASSIRGSTIYQGLFAIGGKNVYDNSKIQNEYKKIWTDIIIDQLTSLDKHTQAYLKGEISKAMFVHRIARISDRSITAFHASEKQARESEGFTKAWRSLNPAVEHCKFCPGYATYGWIGISDLIPPGSQCPCSCKCSVRYKK